MALLRYYEGRQSLSHVHPALLATVDDRVRQAAINWLRLVVDALEERINLDGFRLFDDVGGIIAFAPDRSWPSAAAGGETKPMRPARGRFRPAASYGTVRSRHLPVVLHMRHQPQERRHVRTHEAGSYQRVGGANVAADYDQRRNARRERWRGSKRWQRN